MRPVLRDVPAVAEVGCDVGLLEAVAVNSKTGVHGYTDTSLRFDWKGGISLFVNGHGVSPVEQEGKQRSIAVGGRWR